MAVLKKGVLAVWVDIGAAERDDFNEWYDKEHLSDRVSVPGFLNGRRFEAVSGGPEFFAVYETKEPGVLTSAAYRDRLQQPTPWTRRVMPNFRNTVRGICEQTIRCGYGTGGIVATIRFTPDPAKRWPLRGWLAETGLPRIVGLPGILAVSLSEGMNEPPSKGSTQEVALRGSPDRAVDWFILLEGISPGQVEAAARSLLADAAQADGVDAITAETAVYKYMCGVLATDLGA